MESRDSDTFDPDAPAIASGIYGLPHTVDEARVMAERAGGGGRDGTVGIGGGDLSVPCGAIAAASQRPPPLGVLHLDAQAALREAYEGFPWSHASIMFNVLSKLPAVGPLVQV